MPANMSSTLVHHQVSGCVPRGFLMTNQLCTKAKSPAAHLSERLYTKAKSQKTIQQAPISLRFVWGMCQRKTDGDKPLLHKHTWELREVVGLGLHNIAHAREQDVRDLVICLACQSTLGVTHSKIHDLLNQGLGFWKLPPLQK